MNQPTQMTYEYRCNGCRDRFEVVRTFRQWQAWPAPGEDRPAGYPEQQPECPTCHSHDTARLTIHPVDHNQQLSLTR